MKSRLPKRQSASSAFEAFLVHVGDAIDHSIPALRTILIVAGLVAAAAHAGKPADFLFATGLLFHFAIVFEQWWTKKRTR